MSYIKIMPYNPNKHKLFVIQGERTFAKTHGPEVIIPASIINSFWNINGVNIYVAEVNNKPVAYTFCIYGEVDSVNRENLNTIFTLPQFRKKGIMKKLLSYTISELYRMYYIPDITADNLLDDNRSDKSLISCGFEISHINTSLYNGRGGKVLIHKNINYRSA